MDREEILSIIHNRAYNSPHIFTKNGDVKAYVIKNKKQNPKLCLRCTDEHYIHDDTVIPMCELAIKGFDGLSTISDGVNKNVFAIYDSVSYVFDKEYLRIISELEHIRFKNQYYRTFMESCHWCASSYPDCIMGSGGLCGASIDTISAYMWKHYCLRLNILNSHVVLVDDVKQHIARLMTSSYARDYIGEM
jgi:hypothetical protein